MDPLENTSEFKKENLLTTLLITDSVIIESIISKPGNIKKIS